MRLFFKLAALTLLVLGAAGMALADDAALVARLRASGGPEKYPDASHIILFDSTMVEVAESGLSRVTMHQVAMVLKPAGARELAVIKYDYDPLSAAIEVQQARIIRKNGAIELLPASAVMDMPAPARAIYWGARQKVLSAGRLEPGDALETIVFRKGFTYALLEQTNPSAQQSEATADEARYVPPMRGHFYDIVPFWSPVPVLLKSYTVQLPVSKELQYEFYNGEARSWMHRVGEHHLYHWEKSDILPIKAEAYMVDLSDVAPKLLLSTAPDWQAKSRWFYGVNEEYGSFTVTPEIKAQVDLLVANCRSDEEKVDVLTHWVAEEIRYSGLSMGEGEGFTLHKGEMTFRDRSGVCKDKAGMLITMLRAAGLEAYAAMTMAGSRIDRIPADQFNHSVTVWRKGDGTFVLLDPTWVPGVRELWSSAEQQQQYLMGLPEGADLMTTPVSPPENHYFRVMINSRLDEQGTLTSTFTMTAEGQSDSRIRGAIKRFPPAARTDYFQQILLALAPQARMERLSFGDPEDLGQPITATINCTIPGFARRIGDRLVFTPLAGLHPWGDRGANGHLYMNLTAAERRTPFAIGCSKWVVLEETVQLPRGYTAEHLPEFTAENGPAADFSASYTVADNRLTCRSSLKMKKRIYSAEEWPNFRAALQGAQKMLKEPVILAKK